MSARTASTLVIGVFAALACLLTSYILLVPVWVLFVGWASFYTAGAGGGSGATLARSLTMNVIGVIVAALAMWVILAGGGAPWLVAVAVGVGAAILVALGALPATSATPAGFLGFAAMFGVFAAGGLLLAPLGWDHAVLLTVGALVVGGLFGLLATAVGSAITAKQPEPATA